MNISEIQKQPSKRLLIKSCCENMQQIYRRTPMQKCYFNKIAVQLHWNHTSAWVFSCKFAAYFLCRYAYLKGDCKINRSNVIKQDYILDVSWGILFSTVVYSSYSFQPKSYILLYVSFLFQIYINSSVCNQWFTLGCNLKKVFRPYYCRTLNQWFSLQLKVSSIKIFIWYPR